MQKYPVLGMKKVLYEFERLIFWSHLYGYWITLKDKEKVYIKRKLTLIIQKYILKDLWVAIAKDILTQEGINIDSHVYVYLNKYVFHGNTRKFLVFLQDVLDTQDTEEKKHEDIL